MPLFTYRAINADSAEVRGQIDSLNLDAAKKALEEIHLDVVEIQEASRLSPVGTSPSDQKASGIMAFAFEGTDSSGNVRRGTIQSDSKKHAFDRLKQDQKLMLTMLSPLGVTPEYRDHDLENWQRKDIPEKQPTAPPRVLQFTPVDSPKKSEVFPAIAPASSARPLSSYHPLLSTLRLYAGWLLAWYSLFVSIGYYATVRALPFEIPFVQAFFVSPLIYTCIVAIFLFLFLGSLSRVLHGRWITGLFLTIVGIAALYGVHVSLPSS